MCSIRHAAAIASASSWGITPARARARASAASTWSIRRASDAPEKISVISGVVNIAPGPSIMRGSLCRGWAARS